MSLVVPGRKQKQRTTMVRHEALWQPNQGKTLSRPTACQDCSLDRELRTSFTKNEEPATSHRQLSTAFPHLHQKYVIDSSLDTLYSRSCIFSSLSDFAAPQLCRNCQPENQVSGESRKPRTQPESELYRRPVRSRKGSDTVECAASREYNTRYCGTPLTRTTNGRTFRIPRLFYGSSQTSQIIH